MQNTYKQVEVLRRGFYSFGGNMFFQIKEPMLYLNYVKSEKYFGISKCPRTKDDTFF